MPYTPSTPTMSLIQQPQSLSPVNAPLWYVTSLQNNSFINFKNVFTLYSYDRFSGTSSFLGQYPIPPRPDNFLGVFDAHKILQSQVGSYTFSYDQSGLQGVIDNNSVVKYKAFYGYVYNPNYKFDNTFSYNILAGDFVSSNTFNIRTDDGFNSTISPQGFTISSNNNVNTWIFSQFSAYPTSNFSFKINDGVNNQNIIFKYPTPGTITPPYYLYVDPSTPFKNNSGSLPTNYTISLYINTVSTNCLGLDFNNYSPNLLQPNDIINVYMDNQNQNGSYNGLTEVILPVLSPATASVTTTYYGVTPSSPETGTINSLQRLTGSSSYSYAFPGTRQYTQNNIDFGITNGISSESSNWATNYNGVKQIFLNQYETLSLMSLTESGIANSYYQVNTYDSNWNLLNNYTSTQPTGITLSYIKYELGSGTKNLQGWNINGTPISIPTTGYYTIGLINNSSNINAIFTYSVVNNCSRYPNVRIMFQNRVGGYDYWNFNYDSKWTININRTLYTKQLDYNYKIGDRGRTILNIDANEMYSASTDWISEGDYYYLQELITSSDVFVIDEVNNYKLPINIEDTSYVQKTALRDRLFNLTINYKYSYDINLSGS
jgi:hypothetical protein